MVGGQSGEKQAEIRVICGEISVMWFRFVLSWTIGGGGNGTHMVAHVHKCFFFSFNHYNTVPHPTCWFCVCDALTAKLL